MAEGHRTVVRIALLDEDVAVEAAHLRDGEDADAAERTSLDGQDLALGDVAAEFAVGIALEAIECNVARRDVSFERAAGKARMFTTGSRFLDKAWYTIRKRKSQGGANHDDFDKRKF